MSHISLQHVRHATSIVTIGGKRLLVDPMLAEKGAIPPSRLIKNPKPNPVVGLPVDLDTVQDVDAVVLTHTHFDHFDDRAAEVLPRQLPVICQPADEEKIQELGFENVIAVSEAANWEGLTFLRTKGNHGTGLACRLMGHSSGWVIKGGGRTLFIGGDAVYDDLFQEHLDRHRPDALILFGGAARLFFGSPITMDAAGIVAAAKRAPDAATAVVHLEALSHCGLRRDKLQSELRAAGLAERVVVPADGEQVAL